MPNGVSIIIKGGSLSIKFDEQVFVKANDKFVSADKRIKRVEVIDDNTGQTETILTPPNGKCTIIIHTS